VAGNAEAKLERVEETMIVEARPKRIVAVSEVSSRASVCSRYNIRGEGGMNGKMTRSLPCLRCRDFSSSEINAETE